MLMLRDVRFQDVVDISQMTLGRYEVPQFFLDQSDPLTVDFLSEHPYVYAEPAFATIENTEFGTNADFLHVHLLGPMRLVRTRFRSTLDMTDAQFKPNKAFLCLSYSRFQRVVLRSQLFVTSTVLHPLRGLQDNSVVRALDTDDCRIDASKIFSTAHLATGQRQNSTTSEPLPSIYRQFEAAFREARDQRGYNEAAYLRIVAQGGIGPLSQLWGDLPSRYTVDAWRAVWVSLGIIAVFAALCTVYFTWYDRAYDAVMTWGLWRLRAETYERWPISQVVYLTTPASRERAFRFRVFQSMLGSPSRQTRPVSPLKDACALSARAFLKLGLGTIYPKTRLLWCLTLLEWLLGAFMLIHFLLALRNNLPFLLPFLGVVN